MRIEQNDTSGPAASPPPCAHFAWRQGTAQALGSCARLNLDEPASLLHGVIKETPLAAQEWQVCQVSVGVLGDVCRAIEEQVPHTFQPL